MHSCIIVLNALSGPGPGGLWHPACVYYLFQMAKWQSYNHRVSQIWNIQNINSLFIKICNFSCCPSKISTGCCKTLSIKFRPPWRKSSYSFQCILYSWIWELCSPCVNVVTKFARSQHTPAGNHGFVSSHFLSIALLHREHDYREQKTNEHPTERHPRRRRWTTKGELRTSVALTENLPQGMGAQSLQQFMHLAVHSAHIRCAPNQAQSHQCPASTRWAP